MTELKQIRVSAYIAQTLVAHGVRHVFLLTGGGAMFLNDALGHQSGLEAVCCHHEQTCAMAAEAYARINDHIGVINVTTGGGNNHYDRQRIEAQADRLAQTLPSTETRVLDIGCTGGGLLLALRQRGYRSLHGVDGAPTCIERLSQQGITASVARLSALNEVHFPEKFDLIVLSHVLEHVVDLQQLLSAATSLLTENGKIYVETPDASRYTAADFVPYYFFDSEHINHFDIRALGRLARSAGFFPHACGQITLEVSAARHYPACWAWFARHEVAASGVAAPHPPPPLHETIRHYIAESAANEGYPVIDDLARSQAPLIVWGAGSYAQRLFSQSALANCNIIGITDNDHNKQGKLFGGYPVSSPEALIGRHPGSTVLVAAAIKFDEIAAAGLNLAPTATVVAPTRQATTSLARKIN